TRSKRDWSSDVCSSDLTIGYLLLPSTLGAKEQIRQEVKEFLAEAVVEKDFEYIGSHIIDASTTSFKNVYIIEIIREDERIFPVRSEERRVGKECRLQRT